MSRRFSDEPINLIHRIPTPEQLSAARPSKRSFSQALVESGAACVRGLAEVVSQMRRLVQTAVGGHAVSPRSAIAQTSEPAADGLDSSHERKGKPEVSHQRPPATESPKAARKVEAPRSGAEPTVPGVQPEEVAELRAYLLSQQQDIARLSTQIQELKALVVSQQQVLMYLGKDLEQTPVSSVTAVASGPAKRNRAVRVKEKPVVRKDTQKQSLSL